MNSPQRINGSLDGDPISLRLESLTVVTLFTGAIAYIWLALALWPATGNQLPVGGWIGMILLVTSSLLSFVLMHRHLGVSTHLLVWGMMGAITCAITAFRIPDLAYFFILPIIFGSLLLRQWEVFVVALLSTLAALTASSLYLSNNPYSIHVILPVITIATVAVASWLSARNLYIALTWVWSGYQRALHNEQIARTHQSELRRILKVLDETNYRLERATYMANIARDQAIEAQRHKQQFAQNISHELRTPLNLIVGFSELMMKSPDYYGGPLSQAYLRELSVIHRNAKHLETLVNDVLDLARIDNAQMALVTETTYPAALVEDAVKTARSLVETHGLELHTEIAADLPPLHIDPTRIRQVLFNLLNNAARFTDKGSITVGVRREGSSVLFSVADTGIGIAAQEVQHIFQEFYQLDNGTRRRGGVGLGLAISKRFISLHGGRIWAESTLGVGSTFYFTLPIGDHETNGLQLVSSGALHEPFYFIPERREERILLVVTRSLSAATLLTRYISGHRTVAVHDLEQGRTAAKKLLPQAVIIDTSCIAVDQVQLNDLMNDWQLPETFFMSCPLPGEDAVRQQMAVDGYLIKPISPKNVTDVLRQYGAGIENVLVIDDNREFVRLLRRLLDGQVRRYQVLTATSGEEGLAMMRLRCPDLVFLDMILPDLNGDRIVEAIRANPTWRHIPIIIVSGQDDIVGLKAQKGSVLFSKTNGLEVKEIVRWIGLIVDTSTGNKQANPTDKDENPAMVS